MNESKIKSTRDNLIRLYRGISKHSAYQTIPDFVSSELGYTETIQSNWRGDRNRLDYIQSKLKPLPGDKWCDFGANTGFFTYTLAHNFPEADFVAIEANQEHAEFLGEIKELFSIGNVETINRAIALDDLQTISGFDVMLHLNVLHHAGADFDKEHVFDQSEFSKYAVSYLRKLRAVTHTLIFQMGSNLWGDKNYPLIDVADDVGKIIFISKLITDAGWSIKHLAYPKSTAEAGIVYEEMDRAAIDALNTNKEFSDAAIFKKALMPFNLHQHIGEFYRRGLYILS